MLNIFPIFISKISIKCSSLQEAVFYTDSKFLHLMVCPLYIFKKVYNFEQDNFYQGQ